MSPRDKHRRESDSLCRFSDCKQHEGVCFVCTQAGTCTVEWWFSSGCWSSHILSICHVSCQCLWSSCRWGVIMSLQSSLIWQNQRTCAGFDWKWVSTEWGSVIYHAAYPVWLKKLQESSDFSFNKCLMNVLCWSVVSVNGDIEKC